MAGFPATGGHAPPRRRKTGRKGGWTQDKRTVFLNMLVTCLNVRRAADAVGLTTGGAYQLKRRDREFSHAWAEALDEGYGNLEMEMLRQSIEGCATTETVLDGAAGTVRHVKIVHSYPHAMALRLMQAHREEVHAHRAAEGAREDDEAVAMRVRAQMDEVRARLTAHFERMNAERASHGDGDGG